MGAIETIMRLCLWFFGIQKSILILHYAVSKKVFLCGRSILWVAVVFLLTNYQEDFLNYFVPGEDFIYYSSYKEAETYAGYYLSHEKERQQIAANALGKILDAHTFEHRIQTMLSIL